MLFITQLTTLASAAPQCIIGIHAIVENDATALIFLAHCFGLSLKLEVSLVNLLNHRDRCAAHSDAIFTFCHKADLLCSEIFGILISETEASDGKAKKSTAFDTAQLHTQVSFVKKCKDKKK